MRTKSLLLTAALSAIAIGTATAQTVYSVNAVGYIRLEIPSGFSIIANQLDSGNNTVGSLIPTAPDGTTIYKFTGNGYSIVSFDELDGAWLPDGDLTLNPGEAAFVRNVTTSPMTVTFVGEVPQGALSQQLPDGFSMQSSQVPQAGLVTADLGMPAQDGDTVYQFSNAANGYVINTFDGLDEAWLPAEPSIAVGEGFFLRKITAGTWDRQFSVND